MSIDAKIPLVLYTVTGRGPFALPWPYQAGAVVALAGDGQSWVQLAPAEYTVTPEASDTEGGVILSIAAAADYAGRTLQLLRATPQEQGWVGQNTREKGLEAQLDQMVQVDQETAAQAARSLRVTGAPIPPALVQEGHAMVWQGGAFVPGPDADQIAAAQGYAERAEAAAIGAEAAMGAGSGIYQHPHVFAEASDTLTLPLANSDDAIEAVFLDGAVQLPGTYARAAGVITFSQVQPAGRTALVFLAKRVPLNTVDIDDVQGLSETGRGIAKGELPPALNWGARADFIAAEAGLARGLGAKSGWRKNSVVFLPGTVGIADAPGWHPDGFAKLEHFASLASIDADATAAFKAAIAYVGGEGGGGMLLLEPRVYEVDLDGVFDATNGDLNVCIRMHTEHPVFLTGVPGKTIIRKKQNATIAHVIQIGRRVGAEIPAQGGVFGIIVEGNRDTAVPLGIPYEGGDGINVSGHGQGVRLSRFEVHNCRSYGVGWQRAWWKNCVTEDFVITNTGRDAIDWKVDANTSGFGDNWIQRGRVAQYGLDAEIVSETQQAGVDARYGVNVVNMQIFVGPGQAGLRLQHDDDASTIDSALPNRQIVSGILIVAESGSLIIQGALTPSRAMVVGTCWPTISDVTIKGGEIGMRVRSHRGVFSNITVTDAVQNGIEIISYSTDVVPRLENVFSNVVAVGSGTDVLVDGNTAVTGNTFLGLVADTVVLQANANKTEIIGGRVTTYTNNGTDNRILTQEFSSSWKFGRSATQCVSLSGDASENLVQGQSAAGVGKKFRLANDANGSTVVLEQMATGKAIEIKNTSGTMITVTPSDTRFFRANGEESQGVILGGDSSFNFLKGLSVSGSAKSLLIEQGAEGSTFILNQAASGQSLSFRYQGAESLGINGARVLAAVPIWVAAGSAAAPSVSFGADADTGLFHYGADVVGMALGGVAGFAFSASTLDLLAVSTEARGLQIGQGRAGSGTSYVDLVGDTTYSDYGARLVRAGGANGDTSLLHRGTGTLRLTAQEAAPIVMSTSGAARVTVADTLVTVAVPIKHASYTVATAPAPSGLLGSEIFVSNESGGSVLAFSDGVNWRRVTDRAIIS